jgi:peptidoglycan hydrolase-like protein with peptidoglycan-binding domain
MSELNTNDQGRLLQEAAQREEDGLQMSGAMKLLIENKLKSLGLKPGKQDGEFNKATRDALAEYQQSRGVPVTGYVTRQTVVRLMSE